jgi:putative redox protein
MSRPRTAELTFEGGMRFAARTGTGREITFDDAPEAGQSPVELVVTSLAACAAMDVISIALKKRQGIARYAIHVAADQRDEYPQVLTRIEIVHEVEGEPDALDPAAIRRCIELSAEKYCPINVMLSAGETEVHHRYRVLRTGLRPEEGEVLVTGPYRRPEIVPGG